MERVLALDATAQLSLLASRRISALELFEATLARCQAVNPALNAVVAMDMERALERARAIDERRVRGDALGALAGLPMTIKDTLDVDGMPASAGLNAFRHGRRRDAVVVAHVRAAGAVIWGKTNVPAMAADWQTDNDLYGATNNPWDLSRTPGGSSGGAAAALAAGLTALEVGSDLGGSLRVPASFCGVFAHKPTWGLVSQLGHVPPAPGSLAESDLNVIGPMARSARDLRLLLSVLQMGAMAPKATHAVELKELRIGLWLDEPGFPVDPQVRQTIEAFAADLAAQGAQVAPVRQPVDLAALRSVYGLLLGALVGAAFPPGVRRRIALIAGPARLFRRFAPDPEAWPQRVMDYGASHRAWLEADELRARLAAHLAPIFQRLDVLMAPAAPLPAFEHDHRPFHRRTLVFSDGTRAPYLAMLRWAALASALGLPATAFPAGQTPAGLPVGVQLIGARGADSRVIAIAEAIEDRLGGARAPPATILAR